MTEEIKDPSLIDLSTLSSDDRTNIIDLIKTRIGEDGYVINEDELAFTPKLSEEQAKEFQASLAKSINRGNLGAEIIKLGTEGFKAFLIAILKPAFGSPQKPNTHGGSE